MSAIELYEKLFYVFAGMGALSLALSIFLFIRFDIPQTYAMLTGKARRKTIQEIERQNAQTGRLRQNPKSNAGKRTDPARKRQSVGSQKRPAESGRSTGSQKRPSEARRSPGRTPQSDAPRRERRPRPTVQPTPAERPETEVLSAPAMQTVMLSKPTGLTEELARTETLKPVRDASFYFQMTENTICIHTDELI